MDNYTNKAAERLLGRLVPPAAMGEKRAIEGSLSVGPQRVAASGGVYGTALPLGLGLGALIGLLKARKGEKARGLGYGAGIGTGTGLGAGLGGAAGGLLGMGGGGLLGAGLGVPIGALFGGGRGATTGGLGGLGLGAVSYTHLTLPTILLV